MEIAYEQGILSNPNINKVQRWALSYLICERQRIKNEDQKEHWKNQLFISDRALFDQIYNPQSGVTDEQGNQTDAEQGFDSPEEMDMDALMKQLQGDLTTKDSALTATQSWQ